LSQVATDGSGTWTLTYGEPAFDEGGRLPLGSRARVLDALQALGHDGPVTTQRARTALEHACRRLFGSFPAARDAAPV